MQMFAQRTLHIQHSFPERSIDEKWSARVAGRVERRRRAVLQDLFAAQIIQSILKASRVHSIRPKVCVCVSLNEDAPSMLEIIPFENQIAWTRNKLECI